MKPICKLRYLPLVLLGIIGTLLSYYTPMVFDDWEFQRMYLKCNGGSNTFSFHALKEFVCVLRTYDNARLSNVLASAFAAVPWMHAIFPLITGIVVVIIAWFTCRTGISRCPRWKALTVSASLCILVLPWRDALFSADLSLNYAYPAAVTLCFTALLLRGLHRGFNPWLSMACIIFAILAGWWHEEFAFTTFAGAGVLTICRRFRMPVMWYVIGIVFLAVSLLAFICPGMINRTKCSIGVAGNLSGLHVLITMLPVLFMTGVSVFAIAFKPFREAGLRAVRSDVFILFASISLWGAILSLSVAHSVRISFWPTCASMVAVWKLYSCLPAPKAWIRVSLTIAMAATALFVAVSAIIWQRKYWQEAQIVESMFDNTDKGHIYYDVIGIEPCPIYTLYIPVRHAWENAVNMPAMSENKGRCLGVIPTELRTINREKIEPLPGTARMCRYGNSLIYLPTSDEDDLYPNLLYTLKDGRSKIATDHYNMRFTNEDGIEMIYNKAWRIIATEVCQVDKI